MSTTYTPVDQDIMEYLEAEKNSLSTRVFYFGTGTELKEIKGKVTDLERKNSYEYYLKFDSGNEVRIDRIISYNLKPGPAYDEYDAYGLQCLTCQAGYDF
ncbi:MAG: hypothetical protein GX102_15240 [Porphyromonadaceae bacterium]|nr:hypothetical protein [Porphyromonadaceae bacterium]